RALFSAPLSLCGRRLCISETTKLRRGKPRLVRSRVGFSDKLKQLKQQAQEAVAENKDKIHEAVEVVSVGADQKTHGKYTAKIAKFGQKASDAVDKFSGDADGQAGDGAGAAQDPSAAAPPAGGHVAPQPEAGLG